MSGFVLSKATIFSVDIMTQPIVHALAILRRDMDALLTKDGPDNHIRLRGNASLGAEVYHVKVEENAITIEYGDDLGAVYGILSISERFLNVQPFGYWNDLKIVPQPSVAIAQQTYASQQYAVRYRGWFVNDEVLLDGWPDTPEDTMAMWQRIFETILRCGGNMVIPGTDRKNDGDALWSLALDMGLWITHHHTELLGAEMFARAYPGVEASYTKHPALFEALWQRAIDKYAGRKVIWGVGYRGQGDCAFWESETGYSTEDARGAMIVSVMQRQMAIVREKDPDALFCTNLYGEMMGLYRAGHLPLPDEVIRVWGDNGYGKMVSRRTGNDNPRVPSMPVQEAGLNGLYYHASFYDLQAANHITMSPNSPALLAGELSQAVQNGTNALWNINVGSIKPHIYILDLIREAWADGGVDVQAHAERYARTYFGNESVAKQLLSFSGHTMPYGPNEDDRAGDQYYHFVLRHITRAIMRGDTKAGLRSLFWAAGEGSFGDQVARIGAMCRDAVPGWKAYLAACEDIKAGLTSDAARLLDDTLILQAVLHETGCRGLAEVCWAAACLRDEQYPQAFCHVHRALAAHREGVQAMKAAEHGVFRHFYRNDCFSNVRLTVRSLETLQGWIRICYDGEHCYDWERAYLYPPEDRGVWCLTHRTNQLSDDALAEALIAALPEVHGHE